MITPSKTRVIPSSAVAGPRPESVGVARNGSRQNGGNRTVQHRAGGHVARPVRHRSINAVPPTTWRGGRMVTGG